MRKSKKIILGVTVMSMMMSVAAPIGLQGTPVGIKTVSAEVTAQGRCGDNVEYQYDDKTATLTISGTGDMWDDYGFAKNLSNTKNIVIENGVTSIGSYSFYNLGQVTNVTIADTVTTIKKKALGYIDGTLEIPSSVTKVESEALDGAKKVVLKGNVSGYETRALGEDSYIGEVVVCGSAPDLGKAVYDSGVGTVTIDKDNKGCKIGNGCLMSTDGTQLYYCINNRGKVNIPDTVQTISTAAFSNVYLDEVTFGQNLKTVGDFAFAYSHIGKLKLNKKLAKIGVKAFYNTGIKKVVFSGKVKMNVASFNSKTTISNAKKFKYSQTTLDKATVGKKKYSIKFAKISGAKGYEIVVKKGKKTYKYTTTKNSYTKSAPKALTKNYDVSKAYDMQNDEYLKTAAGAAKVKVRPYQLVKKSKKSKKTKKVYGMWSQEMVLSAQ